MSKWRQYRTVVSVVTLAALCAFPAITESIARSATTSKRKEWSVKRAEMKETHYSKRMKRIHKYTQNLLKWWGRSSRDQRKRGKEWYPIALQECSKISHDLCFSTYEVVHATAALSPLCAWKTNLKKVAKLGHAMLNYHSIPQLTTSKHQNQALACLSGRPEALSGPKVTEFAKAILGDQDACVIDKHMLKAMGWEKKHTPNPGPMYGDCALALKVAAHCARVLVTTFQATVWLTMKEAKDDRSRDGEGVSDGGKCG